MKKVWTILLTALLVLAVPLTAAAQETAGCRISADSMAAIPGQTVTVPVRISGNPGFTNFAIGIKYDTASLKLEQIDTAGGEEHTYLCPEAASVNLAYVAQDGATPCSYVNAAAAEPVTGDGILFTMTFTVLQQDPGATAIDLDLQYLRSGDALSSIFTALTTAADDGAVQIVIQGDVNADGSITDADAAFAYRSVNENLALTDAQRMAADVNGDGMVDTSDAALIYRIVHNTLTGFPGSITEEVTE